MREERKKRTKERKKESELSHTTRQAKGNRGVRGEGGGFRFLHMQLLGMPIAGSADSRPDPLFNE